MSRGREEGGKGEGREREGRGKVRDREGGEKGKFPPQNFT